MRRSALYGTYYAVIAGRNAYFIAENVHFACQKAINFGRKENKIDLSALFKRAAKEDNCRKKNEDMRKIVFATNNEHKLNEIRDMLKDDFQIVSLAETGCHEDIPETADTLEGNAFCKVHYVVEHYGTDCFADDTGLEVDALGGEPGIYTARFGMLNGYGAYHDAEANTRCLLDKMRGISNRKARFRTAIALHLNGEEHVFNGVVEGEITTEKRGIKGFGYDPVFLPDGYSGTFAELGTEIKNKISHRARAVALLAEFLRREYGK